MRCILHLWKCRAEHFGAFVCTRSAAILAVQFHMVWSLWYQRQICDLIFFFSRSIEVLANLELPWKPTLFEIGFESSRPRLFNRPRLFLCARSAENFYKKRVFTSNKSPNNKRGPRLLHFHRAERTGPRLLIVHGNFRLASSSRWIAAAEHSSKHANILSIDKKYWMKKWTGFNNTASLPFPTRPWHRLLKNSNVS